MTFNTIMVQLDLETAGSPRLKFGWELARRFEADMIAFAAAEASLIIPVGDNGMAAAEAMRLQVEQIEARLKSLEQEFQTITNDDPRASWRGHVGDPTRTLALHARAADLIVVGSPSRAPGNLRGSIDPGALILSAGRPILLVSEDLAPVRPDSVVVGWKDIREARRGGRRDAISDAGAECPCRRCRRRRSEVGTGGLADVVRFLMRHGVKARSEVVDVASSLAVDALAQVASEMGANLLVAGGYCHSRLREWAFGGVTRSLLGETGLHRLISN